MLRLDQHLILRAGRAVGAESHGARRAQEAAQLDHASIARKTEHRRGRPRELLQAVGIAAGLSACCCTASCTTRHSLIATRSGSCSGFLRRIFGGSGSGFGGAVEPTWKRSFHTTCLREAMEANSKRPTVPSVNMQHTLEFWPQIFRRRLSNS